MPDQSDLSQDYPAYREDLLREAETLGEPQQAVLFSTYASLAAENGDTSDLTYVPILREGARPFQVDGYAWDPAQGELHLAVCDYHSDDELQTINFDRADQLFKRVRRFCELAIDRDFVQSLEETSPSFDLASLLFEIQGKIKRIRCVLFSNARLATRKKTLEADDLIGAQMSQSIIDFARFIDIQNAQGGTEPIELDVQELNEGALLPCLDAHDCDESVESYLVVMPATLLARIYGLYGARLMEQNVRTFLQARTKTNKGIITTAKDEPGMFFAYNNGITATASGIVVGQDENGQPGIEKIEHLQIVNGGQTTASLLYASDHGSADLSKIFVQMKLSVIDPTKVDDVVPKISRYANTQNRVSEADFFSNHQFHVEMQKISRRLLAPVMEGRLAGTKWFYERARGQYRNETARKSAKDRNTFQAEFPRNQVIQKTDLAKYQISFRPDPAMVSLGAQKCFLGFADEIGKKWESERAAFNDAYFKEMVAKAIIFKSLDREIARAQWYKDDRGYKANIVTHTIAWLVHHLNKQKKKIDFELVWKKQEPPVELQDCLELLAPQVANLLKTPPAGFSNISEYAKKPACWSRISEADLECSDDVLEATISFDEAQARSADNKAAGKIDIELEFEQLLFTESQRILGLEGFLRQKGLLSPNSQSAIGKLKRHQFNLSKSEKRALEHLFKRLDDEFDAGPKQWAKEAAA